MTTIKTIKIQALKALESAKDLRELNGAFQKYLGKRGELTRILRGLGTLPQTKKVKIGKEANGLKNFLTIKFDEKALELKKTAEAELEKKEWIDVTIPGQKLTIGHLHPLTLVKRKAEQIFQEMGFTVIEGPDIESEWYNFDALNIPKEHPARDLWDTFWLKGAANSKLLLRTHTSPVQIRYMEKNNPPLKIIVPGNVFRHEATDSSHDFQHFQVEGLMVGKEVSAANFKAVAGEFFQRFFGKGLKFRLRPDFFPFTEPSFDVSISCLFCEPSPRRSGSGPAGEGKGCSVCKGTGWLEVGGAGMVHPNVFENAGLNPNNWQGWAFGFGLERLAMLKYKINDIRLFRSGDLRFLQQF